MAIKKMKYCPKCGFEIEQSMFYQSKNPHHDGFLPYCKDHCNSLYKEYKDKTNDTAKALFYTCALFDVPFVLEVFKKFNENKDRKIKEHQEKLDTKGKKKYTVAQDVEYANGYLDFYWYWDCLNKTNSGANDWSTFYSGTDVDFRDVSNNIKDLEVKESEKIKFILDWGEQSDMNDYEYLEYQFYELTDNVEFQNKAQEGLYRDLCLARLSKRKIESGKDTNGDITKVQKQILDLMKTLKIDNFSEKKQQSLVERMLESRIAIQEKEAPAFYFEGVKKDENIDYLGRGKYFYDHIYRSFHNVLKGSKIYKILKEDDDDTTTEEYEKIMAQGKVKEVK